MITEEQKTLLSRTNKGTPCGDLMRRYWQPVALSEELSADKPLPATILGEELILFRDSEGKPALIGRYCAHQGVDMIYGRVEPDGLRCMYHGWLFDSCGRVVLRGEWLPEKERRWDVGQAAYPCTEAGGIIFTFMGSGETPPLPALHSLCEHRSGGALSRVVHDENFSQNLTQAEETDSERARFLVPNVMLSPDSRGAELRWHVPLNDESHVQFVMRLTGTPAVIGQPAAAAHQILLDALRELAATKITARPD